MFKLNLISNNKFIDSKRILSFLSKSNSSSSLFLKTFQKSFSTNTKTRLDPYLILEVSRNADWQTIKKSYFRLARIYHPDLNKNDERAQRKFLQVKEAYEFFERKFVPEKYVNNRQSYSSKFDDEVEKDKNDSATNSDDKDSNNSGFESIRGTKRKSHFDKRSSNKTNSSSSEEFQFRHTDQNIYTSTDDSAAYFKDEQLKIEVEKQKYISQFLFTRIPVPRSPRMVDRLNIKKISIGKGKMFGPEDYFSFSFLTLLIIFLFMDRKENYKTYSFENLENVNIYNALKPSEVVKIYEENEISPAEQMILNSEEHQKFKHKKLASEIANKVKFNAGIGRINDVPKVDIKKQFKESLNK